jgi:DNA-directed RNA polymerase subunit M/transcription elongation factor TFIIS
MPPAAAKKTAKLLLLTKGAEVKEVQATLTAGGVLEMAAIKSALKKKDTPDLLKSYKTKTSTLFLFGYSTGKAGTENKHELPPPHDTQLFFGDILLVASKNPNCWKTPIPFTSDQYEAFYTRAFGGFEELDSEEEEEEEEEIVAEEEVEEEEEDQPEEEEEEEEEAEEGGDGEVEEEEEISPTKSRRQAVKQPADPKTKQRRSRGTAASTAAAISAAYTTYQYIPEAEELKEELFGVDLPAVETLTPPRQKMVGALTSLFQEHLTLTEIRELEKAIFNGTIRYAKQYHVALGWSEPFLDLYRTYAKHLAANFHPGSYVQNTELFQRYKTGQIGIHELANLDAYQLFESRWKDSFIQQQQREKRQLEGNRAMATDRFTCTRCWKKECTYYEMQTRSADEPMTIFITCLNCGKHWRQ